MSTVNFICKRAISTTAICHGKRNFRKFPIYNKRGTRLFKKDRIKNPDPDVPVDSNGFFK